jgi:hypothetical protein
MGSTKRSSRRDHADDEVPAAEAAADVPDGGKHVRL